jgi:tRNA-specific 2-thiouridylase
MSGGVDSSVAAQLLLEQDHEVVGVFMRHGEEAAEACASDASPSPRLPVVPGSAAGAAGAEFRGAEGRADHKQGCCSASDAADARRVADRLEIPFYALNLQQDFRRIIDYFVDDYVHGRTPNPCVMCNNWLKFGKLFEYADSVGAEYVATGHYAQLKPGPAGPELHCGQDSHKDQSYVLFGIQRDYLPRMLLPVGGFEKPRIRERASQLGLRVADKKDSQEICFVTSGQHDQFVAARKGDIDTSGVIVTTSGRVVGRHQGIERFTIGQRKGLGVALGEPRYVVRIEADTRRVVIGSKQELACCELTARQTNWLADLPGDRFRCRAKIRYNSASSDATAELLDQDRLRVRFEQPRFGVAAGQAVVLYQGSRVLGGGWIESAVPVGGAHAPEA